MTNIFLHRTIREYLMGWISIITFQKRPIPSSGRSSTFIFGNRSIESILAATQMGRMLYQKLGYAEQAVILLLMRQDRQPA